MMAPARWAVRREVGRSWLEVALAVIAFAAVGVIVLRLRGRAPGLGRVVVWAAEGLRGG